MSQKLRRYSLAAIRGLSEADGRLKAMQIEQEFRGFVEFFKAYFAEVDDYDKPQDVLAAAVGMMDYGEWLFLREEHYITGLAFLDYGRPGRHCFLTVLPTTGDDPKIDVVKLIEYIFSDQCPNRYFKIKSVVPKDSKLEQAVKEQFSAVSMSVDDTLLGGTLKDTLTYERYHPQWLKGAGEDLEDVSNTELRGERGGGGISSELSTGTSSAIHAVELPATGQYADEPGEPEQLSDAGVVADRPELGVSATTNGTDKLHDRRGKSRR